MMQLRHDEDGQGMAEFILVLPLLALLTFGTIEVAIYLQQQSTLNAAAFMAARAASVLGNEKGPSQASAKAYADAAGAPWLQAAVGGMKADHSATRSRFELEAKTDRLSGLIDGLTNGQAKGFDTLAAGATLPLEYNAKQFGQRNVTGVQVSHYLISYDSKRVPAKPLELAPKNFNGALTKIKEIKDLAAAVKFTITPSPAPTPKPPAPAPGKTPAPKPPTPKPQPPKTVNLLPIPGIAEILKFSPGATEPFRLDGAVVANPKHGNNSGDGGQATSSQYLEPLYEKKFQSGALDPEQRRVQNILEELDQYLAYIQQPEGKGGLRTGANLLGNLTAATPPVPPGVPVATAAAAAAWQAFYAKLDATRKFVAKNAEGIATGSEQEYERRLKQEQGLFK